MNRGGTFVTLFLFFATALSACSRGADQTSNEPEVKEIILATTSSTRDSGLLEVLVPDFEAQTGHVLKTIAVGTGKALKMGEQGDADVLLVHAPGAEKEFMDGGFGSERFLVMHNDFVIVGPPNDPAGIKGTVLAVETLAQIASTQAAFTSRSDDSGTHKKELSLWKDAQIAPEGEWYLESGQGMGATLRIASEKGTYTLTDRATYLFNRDTLDLDILAEGDPVLLNVYHVMLVNPETWDHVNNEGGSAFADYLISPEVQAVIAEYGVEEFGRPLFFPDAHKTDADLGLE